MIKMSTYALVATSLVAVFSGSGCSNNLKKPTADTPKFQKASLDTTHPSVRKASYRSTASALNPYFRTGVTTPRYSNRIILPREHAQRLTQVIAALPAASPREGSSKAHQYNTLAMTQTGKKAAKGTQYTRVKTKLRSAQLYKRKVNA